MAKLDVAVRSANIAKSTATDSRAGSAPSSDNSIIAAFSTFYSHLDGTARCYDIFDAGDTTLWAHALPFSHIFVFPTVAYARRALDAYSNHLVPVTPQLLQLVTAQVGLDAVDMDNILFRVWYDSFLGSLSSLIFSVLHGLVNSHERVLMPFRLLGVCACMYACVPTAQLPMQHVPGAVPCGTTCRSSDRFERCCKSRGAAVESWRAQSDGRSSTIPAAQFLFCQPVPQEQCQSLEQICATQATRSDATLDCDGKQYRQCSRITESRSLHIIPRILLFSIVLLVIIISINLSTGIVES